MCRRDDVFRFHSWQKFCVVGQKETSKITRDDDEEPFKVRLIELTCLIRLQLNGNDLFDEDKKRLELTQ